MLDECCLYSAASQQLGVFAGFLDVVSAIVFAAVSSIFLIFLCYSAQESNYLAVVDKQARNKQTKGFYSIV